MLIITLEQLARMRGETIKELEQKLDSNMDSALQNSHSVEKQDVKGMYVQ